MFRNIKITIRNLRRSGVYSVINVVGLAASLATCVFIVLWVQDERSYDRFHKDADNIYMAVAHFKTDGGVNTGRWSSGLFAPTAKENFGTVEDYCRIRTQGVGFLKYNDISSSPISCLYADPNFFDFFHFPIVKGNSQNPLQNPIDVVISERLAGELFGNEDPVGKVISFESKKDIHITAVMKDMPRNTYLDKVDMVSLHAMATNELGELNEYYNYVLNGWDGNEFLSFMKIKPGTDVTQLAEQVTEKQTSMQSIRTFTLQPLVKLHLYTLTGEPEGLKTVQLFQWIAIVILVIACINYVNIVTARASKRHREIGLKKIIGAKRWQLFGQLVNEAVILFILAIIVAFALNIMLLPAYNLLSGKEIVFGLFDGNVWGVYAIMFLAVVGLAGIYPAYLLASFKPSSVIQSAKTKRAGNYFRKALVITQFAASTALIVGTIVLGMQMKYMREKDMGYDREHLMVCSLYNMRDHFNAVKAELEQQSSILGVTAASNNIMNVTSGHGFGDWEGKMSEGMLFFKQNRVDTSYLRVMGLELVAGTNFTSTTELQLILNESTVKAMGLTDPVGKWAWQNNIKIVGIVKDFNFQSLHTEIGPFGMYYQPIMFRELYVRTRANNAKQAIAAVEKVWKQYNPDHAFTYSFLDDTFNRMYQSEIRTNRLFGTFSIIAILISCLGLFGLVVFSAELKTKEIGIRKVLGASIFDIVKLLSREFLMLVGIAMLIAFPLAYYWLDSMLKEFAYRIPLSWWIFVVAALITTALTLITVCAQALKSAMANPVEAIKTE